MYKIEQNSFGAWDLFARNIDEWRLIYTGTLADCYAYAKLSGAANIQFRG
jgi:hypothetical protein